MIVYCKALHQLEVARDVSRDDDNEGKNKFYRVCRVIEGREGWILDNLSIKSKNKYIFQQK